MAKSPPPGLAVVISGQHEGPSSDRMPPPGMEEPKREGKASPEEAGVVKADRHCIDCANYSPDTGACSAVEGVFDPDDACIQYFEPVAEDGEQPDLDDKAPTEDATQ